MILLLYFIIGAIANIVMIIDFIINRRIVTFVEVSKDFGKTLMIVSMILMFAINVTLWPLAIIEYTHDIHTEK